MRPSLNIVSDQLIGQILDEARRILSEIGIEVRGPALRQRLLPRLLAHRRHSKWRKRRAKKQQEAQTVRR